MTMKNNPYRDASLILKALFYRLNKEELHELKQLLKDPTMGKVFEKLKSPAYAQKHLQEYNKYDWEKAYLHFAKQTKTKYSFHPIFLKIAGAAAGLILIAGSLWWTSRKNDAITPQIPSATISHSEFQHDKAIILTLGDGQQISVTKHDTLVMTKNGMRLNIVNGNLSYETQNNTPDSLIYNELNIPLGGECVIDLDDGTKVWLNSATKLKYPVRFDKDYREVFLEGEAYFDVNKDKRPFIVNFTSGRIQVLGTEFGIRSYEDDSCHYATLVEGLVHIYTKEGDSLEILPGEQAMISPNEFTKRKVQVDEYVGWKDGFFVFRQRSLGEIATQLEKWYDVQILFANDDLPKLLFTGYLKRYDDIDVFFDALKRTGLINYHIEGNHILVTTN